MNTMTKATQEKKFSPHNSLSNYQHHLKISLAEDYWFSLFSASGFVLRLQLSRGRTPCPDSAWLWFISSSNMPAWLPGLIKGQDNSNSNRSRRVERPCLLCETEHLEIFKRQIREQSSPGHHSAWQWQRRQPHRSLGPLPSRGAMWEEEDLSPLGPERVWARISGRENQKEALKRSHLFLLPDGGWGCSIRCTGPHSPQPRSLVLGGCDLVGSGDWGWAVRLLEVMKESEVFIISRRWWWSCQRATSARTFSPLGVPSALLTITASFLPNSPSAKSSPILAHITSSSFLSWVSITTAQISLPYYKKKNRYGVGRKTEWQRQNLF